jgi:hypothetical protein
VAAGASRDCGSPIFRRLQSALAATSSIPNEVRSTDARKPSVTVREARLDDYQQLQALESRNGLGTKTWEEWSHLWVNNPAGLAEDFPIGWVAEDENKQIVGNITNVPLSYEFQGRKLITAAGRAIVMDPPYRRRFAFMLIRRFTRQKPAELILDTSCNADSAKFHAAYKWPAPPTGAWDKTSFWITRYPGFLASLMQMKGAPQPVARSLSYPLAVALSTKDAVKSALKAKGRYKQAGYRIRVQECFDDRFDEFWQKLRKHYPDRLLGNRSRETLNWHFKYAMANKKLWIVTAETGTSLIGYGIFYRQDNRELQLKRVRLVDFQTLNGDARCVIPMLQWALDQCRRSGIHMLEAFGFRKEKQEIIDELAPYKRQLPAWMYFYSMNDKSLREPLRNPDAWDPTLFDGDVTL